MNHLLVSIECGDVEEVRRILKEATWGTRVVMLKHLTQKCRLYFGRRSTTPSAEVTSIILNNIVEIVRDRNRDEWTYALHIAVLYRMHGIVHTLLTKGVDGTTSVRYDVSQTKTVWAVPMEVAIENEDVHMIALLLSHNIPLRSKEGFTRFPSQSSLGMIKLDLAIDSQVPEHDFETAYRRDMYDRVVLFIAAGVEVRDHHLYGMFFKEQSRYVRLFHTILAKTSYFNLRSLNLRSLNLPSLRETSLHAMRIEEVREDLSVIREALIDVKMNEGWMSIENNPILYPLIREVIDSRERCM